MAFEGLKARIEKQRTIMHNQRYLADMVADAQSLIKQSAESNLPHSAPAPTGTMIRNLTTESGIVETSTGLHDGLGDRSLVGHETNRAQPGVISEFLRDHDEFRLGREKDEDLKKKKTDEKTGFVFDKTKAWAYLSERAKAELQYAREGGMYGGGSEGIGVGMSAYFFQQEGYLDGWHEGAEKSNITPTYFVFKALREWRSQYARLVLDQVARDFKAA